MSLLSYHPIKIVNRTAVYVAMVVLFSMIAGCTKNYGQFTMNSQVGMALRQGEAEPGYNYYYAGRETMPYAIIGIDRSYTVPSRLWIPFEPDQARLQKSSNNIYRERHYQPYGASILDPDGTPIGVWYSNIFNRSVSVNQETHTVEVLFNNPERYDRGTGSGSR